MSIAPECEFELDDRDCDREATHEFVIKDLPNPYSSRHGLVCGGHLDEVLAQVDPSLVTVRDLSVPEQLHAARVPAGYECTRIPTHEGPCALRPLVTAGSIDAGGKRLTAEGAVTTSPYRIATVPTPYRPSKWSSPWILLLPLLGWELWTVATNKAGGPLSHLVWWAYGDRYSLRWFLASMGMNGLGVWAAMHFMFERWEVRELGFCVGLGLILGLLGWLLMAVKW